MAHPMRVTHCPEGKPPQAVRQASAPLATRVGVLDSGGW